MKNYIRFLLALSCSALFLHSCESEIEREVQSTAEKLIVSEEENTLTTDSLDLESIETLKMTDELKVLKERMSELRKTKTRAVSNNYNQYFSENMWAIRELPFTLNTKDGHLHTTGSGQKVGYNTSSRGESTRPSPVHEFYVKIPPSMTGIPYLIYSDQTKTPLAVGHYTNNPNQKVVFVMKDNAIEEALASWNILPATNNPGYYVIQNESYIGQGSSGEWWDIFNYVIEIKGEDASFGKYSQMSTQEFIISPKNSFYLKNLEFINSYSATVNQRENLVIQQATTNSSSQAKREYLEFTKDVEEDSYFEEEKGIAFSIFTSELQFARPTVTLGKIDLTPNTQIPADTKYERNVRKVLPKKLYQSFPVVVKPRTKLVMTYYYKVYDVSIDYVATIEYSDRIAKLPGRWSGRIYVDEIFEPDFEEINLDTQRSVKGKVNIKNATFSSPVTF